MVVDGRIVVVGSVVGIAVVVVGCNVVVILGVVVLGVLGISSEVVIWVGLVEVVEGTVVVVGVGVA